MWMLLHFLLRQDSPWLHTQQHQEILHVANWVTRIWKSTHPEQWHFISKEPADPATRAVDASVFQNTNCLSGPSFLPQHNPELPHSCLFTLVDPEADMTWCHNSDHQNLRSPIVLKGFLLGWLCVGPYHPLFVLQHHSRPQIRQNAMDGSVRMRRAL